MEDIVVAIMEPGIKRQCSDHVEIVVGVSGNKLLTVGGNTGSPGQVRERERTLTSDTVIAYGTFY